MWGGVEQGCLRVRRWGWFEWFLLGGMEKFDFFCYFWGEVGNGGCLMGWSIWNKGLGSNGL